VHLQQGYLEAQGFPVTWTIRISGSPAKRRPTSSRRIHIPRGEDDYIVSLQAHNASTDPPSASRSSGLSPWSFNSPALVPVEVDVRATSVQDHQHSADGEHPHDVRMANARGGSGIEPLLLQAILSHPMDVKRGHNLGQETPRSSTPTAKRPASVVPLHNPARVAQRFTVTATEYRIEETETGRAAVAVQRAGARSTLSTRHRARARLNLDNAAGPDVAFAVRGRIGPAVHLGEAKYVGMERLRERLLQQDVSLPRIRFSHRRLRWRVVVGPGGLAF